MTSLRRALKASLNVEKPPPSTSHRGRGGNSAGGPADRHRRCGDDVGGDRFGVGSDRNRTGSGSSSRGRAGRRGRSSGDGGDDSSEEGDSDEMDESDSDDETPMTSSRGRATVPDRRHGSGGAMKPKQGEAEPVSPPRQSVIAAAHGAEVGSQIKVKFDTGHWYSGTILKVDKKGGMIRIDYDDGTQEVSDIPDSDIVIYPWRPLEQRVRPRTLAQMRAEEAEAKANATKSEAAEGTTTGSSRKVAVKTEPRLPWAPPRSKQAQGRQQRQMASSSRREQQQQSSAPARAGSGRGAPKAAATAASSSSSEEEDDDDDDSEESEEEDEEDDEGEDGDDESVHSGGARDAREARKNVRLQQQQQQPRNGKTLSAAAGRGRQSSQRPTPRKRPGRRHGRGGSALKRRRGAPDGTNTPSGQTSESGSGSEEEEEEEELDDMPLGIKAKARSPRASPQRKPAASPLPKQRKGQRLGGGKDGSKKAPRRAAAGATRTGGSARSSRAAPPVSSPSACSGSESSSSSSSSACSEDARPVAAAAEGRSGGQKKASGGAKGGPASKATSGGGGEARQKDDGGLGGGEPEEGRDAAVAATAAAAVKKEDGCKGGREEKGREAKAAAAALRNGGVQGEEGRRPHRTQEPKKSKQAKPPTAAAAKGARTSTVVKPEAVLRGGENASSGWKDGAKPPADRREAIPPAEVLSTPATAAAARSSNVGEARLRGRGRGGGRGQARGGGGRAKQQTKRAEPAAIDVRPTEGKERGESTAAAAAASAAAAAAAVAAAGVTAPVLQGSAERKAGLSTDLSSSTRKSPRSKETPSSPRLGKGVKENEVSSGPPKVAEAKAGPVACAQRRSTSPASASSSKGVYDWEDPSGKSGAERGGGSAKTAKSGTGPAAGASGKDASRDSDNGEAEASKPDVQKADGAGAQREETKPGGGSATAAEASVPRRPSATKPKGEDVLGAAEEGKTGAESSSRVPTTEVAAKAKVMVSKAEVVASVLPPAAQQRDADSDSDAVKSGGSSPSKPAETAAAAPPVDEAPPAAEELAAVSNDKAEEGLLANGIRDVTSGAMEVDSADEAGTATGQEPTESRAPVADPPAPSAVPSPPSPEAQDAMDVDSGGEEVGGGAATPKPEEAAVVVAGPVKTGCKANNSSKIGETAAAGGGSRGGRLGGGSPLRKRPRSEEKQGGEAKSGWPPPVPSRSARAGPESMDIDEEKGVRDMNSAGAGPASASPKKDVASGAVGLPRSEPKPATERDERAPAATEADDQASSLSEQQQTTDEGIDSPEPTIDPPSTVVGSGGAKVEADGGHQGQDPGSGGGKKGEDGNKKRRNGTAVSSSSDAPRPSTTIGREREGGSKGSDHRQVENGKKEGRPAQSAPGAALERVSVAVSAPADGTHAGPRPPPAGAASPAAKDPGGAWESPTKERQPDSPAKPLCSSPSKQPELGAKPRDSSPTKQQPEPTAKPLDSSPTKQQPESPTKKQPESPTKQQPESPRKQQQPEPPTKQPRSPTKQPRSPTKEPRSPTKEPKSPTKQPRSPTKQPEPEPRDQEASVPAEAADWRPTAVGKSPVVHKPKEEERIEKEEDEEEEAPAAEAKPQPQQSSSTTKDDSEGEVSQQETQAPASKFARSGSADGSDGTGGEEPRHVGRKRSGVTRFEPSMDPDRNRLGQRPERHERQAAVLATKRLAASAPIRRASRGRGHDSGCGRERGGGRRGRGGGGRSGGSRSVAKEHHEVESEEEDDDEEEDDADDLEWVQCDNCEEWWTLPSTLSANALPDVWHCRMQNWGKPVVDCFLPKQPPPQVAAGAAAKGARGVAQPDRSRAERGLLAAPTVGGAVGAAVAAAEAVSTKATAAAAVVVAPTPPSAASRAGAAAAAAAAAVEANATAKADAGLAMVAAVATTAAAMDVANIPPAASRLAAFDPTGHHNLRREAPAIDPPKRFSHPANGPEPRQQQHQAAAALRPPPAHAAAIAAAALAAQTRPVLQFPPALTAENQRAAAAGTTIDDRPTTTGTAASIRRKRRWEGGGGGGGTHAGSDDDDDSAGFAGGRDAGAAGSQGAPEARDRPNGVGVSSCRGRGRKGSSGGGGSMGRDAVASLLRAAESSQGEIAPVAPEVGSGGRGGAAAAAAAAGMHAAARSDGGGGAVFEAPPKADQWVMCDYAHCGKWRRVPPGVSVQGIDKWYCNMGTWNPAASCEQPEDSASIPTPATNGTAGGRSFVVRGGAGSRGGGGGASVRGRRIGSRGRAASESVDAADERAWRRDPGSGSGLERRESDAGSRGGGRGRGRSKKDDVLWVQCDRCLRWRKLALGMRLENLPDKWYCKMNTWSPANHCSYPDEYDAETKQAKGERDHIAAGGGGGSSGGGGGGGGARASGAGGGGLLSRGAGGGLQKANGRLSYREILFNNDGKLRPPYSAGPCASASAGYLFPKPAGGTAAVPRASSRMGETSSTPRNDFYFSERYCPATATGPGRPAPPLDLLTASLKLTGQHKLSLGRFRDVDEVGTTARANGDQASAGRAGGAVEGGAAARWANSNGKSKDSREVSWAAAPATASAAAVAAATVVGPDEPRARPATRRVGTYERERQQRCSVLHYLVIASTPRPGAAAVDAASTVTATSGAISRSTSSATRPEGATAAALLAAMRERPWEGRPNAGSARDWAEWLEHLAPTLERHLRWLVVDGLAAQLDGAGERDARFVALVKEDEEAAVEPGGPESAAPGAGARVATAVAAGTSGTAGAGASSMLAGGLRIMKSRPIKMVKPWR